MDYKKNYLLRDRSLANIVFLGNFEVPYSSENHHAKSLESLGHTVEKMQEKKATSSDNIKAGIAVKPFYLGSHT
jgi:hypothetical protein